MTSDQFWRIVLGSLIMCVIAAYRPVIIKWLRRIGYTGWK